MTAFYRLSSIFHIFSDATFFFTTFTGIVSFVCICITESIIDLFVLTYGTVHIVFSIVYVCFTVICFFQLKHVNNLLYSSKLSTTDLFKFAQYHTNMLSFIFEFNHFSGNILTAFMLGQMPVNTYLVLKTVMRTFSPETSVVFLNFAMMQFLVLVFFHIISATYCKKVVILTFNLTKLLTFLIIFLRFMRQRNVFFTGVMIMAKTQILHLGLIYELTAIYQSLTLIKNMVILYCFKTTILIGSITGITYGSFGLMSFKSFAKVKLYFSFILW